MKRVLIASFAVSLVVVEWLLVMAFTDLPVVNAWMVVVPIVLYGVVVASIRQVNITYAVEVSAIVVTLILMSADPLITVMIWIGLAGAVFMEFLEMIEHGRLDTSLLEEQYHIGLFVLGIILLAPFIVGGYILYACVKCVWVLYVTVRDLWMMSRNKPKFDQGGLP